MIYTEDILGHWWGSQLQRCCFSYYVRNGKQSENKDI